MKLVKGMLLYKYELNPDVDRFDLIRFRVDALGDMYYGVVRLNDKGEVRSRVQRERLQYFSALFGTTPAEAKALLVKDYERQVRDAQSKVTSCQNLLVLAMGVNDPT